MDEANSSTTILVVAPLMIASGRHLYFTTRGLVATFLQVDCRDAQLKRLSRVIPAKRWDQGTSASPSRYRHIYYVLVGLIQSLGAFLPTLTHTHWVGDCFSFSCPSLFYVGGAPTITETHSRAEYETSTLPTLGWVSNAQLCAGRHPLST